MKTFWPVIEPATPFLESWVLDAICEHLEAVTSGEISRLLMNVFPGAAKSTILNVMWPAWEWGPKHRPGLRYLSASYASALPERDNRRFKQILRSDLYQQFWGTEFELDRMGDVYVSNDKTGFKLAFGIEGIGTGFRGDRLLIDDPNNVKDSESDTVREGANNWFHETMSDRLNNSQSAIALIQQRTHEADVSGSIIAKGLDYTYVMIPMEYEPARSIVSNVGWEDPRTEDGELAWPERFPDWFVGNLKTQKGPYAWAGQYQQNPTPRGGGIFNRDWWQLWGNPEDPNDKAFKAFPTMDYTIASVDTAYTEKEENDWSALTVWGVFRDEHEVTKLMLMYAWQDRLTINGRPAEEGDDLAARRKKMGLVERIAESCQKFKVDRLLIEAKASGISVAQEMQRLYRDAKWATQLVDPKGDKVARAYAVQGLFTQALIFAPDKSWAEKVIDECASFPKGAHDDLVDSSVMALKHMRECGFALHRDEVASRVYQDSLPKKPLKPLYDV